MPAEGVVQFHILHWNDFHGELVEHTVDSTWVPGAARLAAFVRSETEKYDPNQTLILDAGDWFEGSEFSRPSKGGKVLEFYKRLGVNAITVGNHEFFMGVPLFYQMVSQASPIEIVSVNLRKAGGNKTCTGERILSPYKIFELGAVQGPKVRVAVIGISLQHLQLLTYSPVRGVCFLDPVSEVAVPGLHLSAAVRVRPCATVRCESRQVRKEAAINILPVCRSKHAQGCSR